MAELFGQNISRTVIARSETTNQVHEMPRIVQKYGAVNGRPIFKNNFEKYEWLVQNDPQNLWLKDFQQSKEYALVYGGVE